MALRRSPRLPLAKSVIVGTGDFAYTISPSIVLVDVLDTAGDLYGYCFGLDGAVRGVTRSIDLVPYDEPLGVLDGRGRVLTAGVYGNEYETDEAGVCDNEGVALIWEVDPRL